MAAISRNAILAQLAAEGKVDGVTIKPTKSVGEGTGAPIKEESILAPSYVPQALRAINEVEATVLTALPPPQIDLLLAIRARLAPYPEDVQQRDQIRPLRSMQNDFCDLHYAVLERMKKLQVPSKTAKNDLKSIDNVSGLQDYCQTFEKLLDEERETLLLLYERYSQYRVSLQIRNNQDSGSTALACGASIPGIADAMPPLQPGDTLLVRAQKSYVPPNFIPPAEKMMYKKKKKLPKKVWRPPPQPPPLLPVVEVRCMVTGVQRAGGGFVFGTWLDPETSYHLVNQSSSFFNLRFIPSIEYHLNCLTALDWVKNQSGRLLSELLFPTEAPILPLKDQYPDITTDSLLDFEESKKTLNVHQAEFVRTVVRRSLHPETDMVRGPLILTGPAGTGKTKTMLHAILKLLSLPNADDEKDDQTDDTNNSLPSSPFRILVCTPSHTAADVITRRLGESKAVTRQSLFRLYAPDRPVATVPVNILGFCRQSAPTGAFSLPPVSELMQFKIIVCTCQDANLLYQVGLTNQQLRVRRLRFEQQIQEQCKASNLKVTVNGVDKPHFTHFFLDEAAQATEPESLIPLSVVVDPERGSSKVEIALVGDPRQLSPSIYSKAAQEKGLGRSWMERLLLRPVSALGGGQPHMLGPEMINMGDWVESSFRENLSIFLTHNYRGHPSFLMMPSALFYFDKLHSSFTGEKTEEWIKYLRCIECLSDPVIVPTLDGLNKNGISKEIVQKKQFDWPIHFRGVEGKDTAVTLETGFSSNSWSNEKEAQAVVDIIEVLAAQNVSTQSIGVMAPFRAQVVLLRNLLREKNLGGVNVGTIENYQAVELDVIVLSLTRSSHAFVANDIASRIGVFGQEKRSNVALTRAEHLFVVVGSPSVMMKDSIWRQFLLFSLRNGLFYGDSGHSEEFMKGTLQSLRIVRSISSEFRKREVTDNKGDICQDVVAVSSLERSFRGL